MSDETLKENPLPKTYAMDINFQFSPKRYDSVVQKEDFKKGNEEERISRLTALSNGSFNGLYDYQDGKDNPNTKPSDIELALRSGSLDKADIDELSKQVKENAKNENEKAKAEQAEKDAKAVSDARQDFLDVATGFKEATSEKSE